MSYTRAVLFFLFVLGPAQAADSGKPMIELAVDATEAPRRLLHAHLTIPAKPGPLTLYYPKWIQGWHQPGGPIADLSGLRIQAGGSDISWRRDDVDLYAFHCTVPDAANAVEVSLDYLAPSSQSGGGDVSITAELAMINWYQVFVYPKGAPIQEQQVHASLTLPKGWKVGTALPVESSEGQTTRFQPVSLEMLADSPALCGRHFREVPIGPADSPPHYLVLACDSAAGLEIPAQLKSQYDRLVAEAGVLFGARHYRSYRFLLTLSDHVPGNGIEHHESSDDRAPERMLVDDQYRKLDTAWLLPHEFVHSWNGKYRRPAGLAVPDFQQPLRTELLWVYEGLTQYLGFVLTGRSGLYTPEVTRENLAYAAEGLRSRGGRTWRPLLDTAISAPFLYSARSDWAARRRGTDFYNEGALIWLDADTLIREKTAGAKTLDDFCRSFYGPTSGPPAVKPYTFDDVVQTLNGVLEYDWKTFLEQRLHVLSPEPPMDGLTRGGWKLVYRDKPGEQQKARDSENSSVDLSSSIGLVVKNDGKVTDVVPGRAADRAGIGPGMKLVAVNGRKLAAERLRHAVAQTKDDKQRLQLLIENEDFFKNYSLEYADGEKYPHLERDTGQPDRLSEIFSSHEGKK